MLAPSKFSIQTRLAGHTRGQFVLTFKHIHHVHVVGKNYG